MFLCSIFYKIVINKYYYIQFFIIVFRKNEKYRLFRRQPYCIIKQKNTNKTYYQRLTPFYKIGYTKNVISITEGLYANDCCYDCDDIYKYKHKKVPVIYIQIIKKK